MVSFRKPDSERRGRREWTAAALKGCLPARLAPLTTETAAVSASAAALALWTSFVDVQRAAFEIRTVKAGDGPVGFLGFAHFDERKAAGITSESDRDTEATENAAASDPAADLSTID